MNYVAPVTIAILAFCLVALILALPLMWLWNGLMPDIFGLPEIGFFQALGMNFLSGILFRASASTSKS